MKLMLYLVGKYIGDICVIAYIDLLCSMNLEKIDLVMKKSNRILIIISVTVITALITYGFTGIENSQGSIVTVRTTEVLSGWDNAMITVYPDGAVEKVELEKLKSKDLNPNQLKINQHLNTIVSKGYELHSVAGGNSEAVFVTTYIFSKK